MKNFENPILVHALPILFNWPIQYDFFSPFLHLLPEMKLNRGDPLPVFVGHSGGFGEHCRDLRGHPERMVEHSCSFMEDPKLREQSSGLVDHDGDLRGHPNRMVGHSSKFVEYYKSLRTHAPSQNRHSLPLNKKQKTPQKAIYASEEFSHFFPILQRRSHVHRFSFNHHAFFAVNLVFIVRIFAH